MTTMTLDVKVQDFLAQKRIAVAGVSRDNSHHPVGNLIHHLVEEYRPRRVPGESAYADIRGRSLLPRPAVDQQSHRVDVLSRHLRESR